VLVVRRRDVAAFWFELLLYVGVVVVTLLRVYVVFCVLVPVVLLRREVTVALPGCTEVFVLLLPTAEALLRRPSTLFTLLCELFTR
jgi:hypothetical protein